MPENLTAKLVTFTCMLILQSACNQEQAIVNEGPKRRAKTDGVIPEGGVVTDISDEARGELGSPEDLKNKAYLHANLWYKFHNFRSWCGPEKSYLMMCEKIKEQHPSVNCDEIKEDFKDCKPDGVQYGFVDSGRKDDEICAFGPLPGEIGCDPDEWSMDARAEHDMRFLWHGPRWSDNYGVTSLKVFKGTGQVITDATEEIGLSSLQLIRDRKKTGVEKRGKVLSSGCAMEMPADTDKDGRFKKPFGGFAWIEVPTDEVVTIIALSGAYFDGKIESFMEKTGPVKKLGESAEDYWKRNPPSGGPRKGHQIYTEEFKFEKGKQYYLGHGSIQEVTGVPDDLKYGFGLYQKDISDASKCARPSIMPDPDPD